MTAADDRGLEDLLERLRTRFYGKYRGIVSAVEPKTMRIKAKVPSVLGEVDTGWCMPCVPYAGPGVGFAFLPDEGSGVWIEFEGGDVSFPIWVGGYWRQGEFPADPGDAADRVKVIVTKASHKVKFDDGDGTAANKGTITLSDPNNNTVTLGSSGITLSGSSVSVNGDALKVM